MPRKIRGFKFQACTYQAKQGDGWRDGVARVETFGLSSVMWIIDAETGEKFAQIWDYRLSESAFKHLFIGEF